MNLSDQQIKLAEDYLDGVLSEDEKAAFETQMSTNTELKEYTYLNKEMRTQYNDQDWVFIKDIDTKNIKELEGYFKSESASELKMVLKKVNSEFQSKNNDIQSKKSWYTFFGLAASIILLVGYFILNNQTSSLDLYQDYNSWQELPSLINRGEGEYQILTKAETAFLNQNYKEAKEFFTTYIKQSKIYNPNAELYLGISQLELNNFEDALNTFDKLITSQTLDYSKGYWYKALVYLKMGDTKNAIKQLEIISNNSKNYNFKEANKLLKKLN